MGNPTAPINFATAFPVAHGDRLDKSRPCYWQLVSPDGKREVYVVATLDELLPWMRLIFGGNAAGARATKWRTAIGTPPF